MKHYDVLVVGGGPAGSTTAIRLADAGARVLLVDKATFPRDKPCGGGLTTRALAHCPVDPSPVVEEHVDLVELRFRFDDSVVRHARSPVISMTQRRRLDAFLLDAARERGVEVREGTTVDPVTAPADYVVGADGANGTTAKAFGLGGGIVHGVAFEGNVPYGVVDRDRYARRAVVELADIPGGYGWVFPKGDHVMSASVRGRTKARASASISRGSARRTISTRRARESARPPFAAPPGRDPVAGERALLVGDAAGLIDPVSGDGMYECFVSSRLAAEAILDLSPVARRLEPYPASLDAAVGRLHSASWKLKQALDRWPRTSGMSRAAAPLAYRRAAPARGCRRACRCTRRCPRAATCP